MGTARDLWEKYLAISSQLPIKLPNRSAIDELEFTCSECDHFPITQQNTHGEIEVTPLGIKVRAINLCILCGKFSFMSGDILMNDKGWFFAFPPANTPMRNPWTGEVIPMRTST